MRSSQHSKYNIHQLHIYLRQRNGFLAVTNLLDAEIELMDVNEQRNWSRQISPSAGEHSVQIDLTGITDGVYFNVMAVLLLNGL